MKKSIKIRLQGYFEGMNSKSYEVSAVIGFGKLQRKSSG